MLSLLFFLGVLIAGLVAHIIRLRKEIDDLEYELERTQELCNILADRLEKL